MIIIIYNMLFRDYSNSMVMSEKHKFAIACKRPYLLHLTVLHPPAPSTPDILYNISTQLVEPGYGARLEGFGNGAPVCISFCPWARWSPKNKICRIHCYQLKAQQNIGR